MLATVQLAMESSSYPGLDRAAQAVICRPGVGIATEPSARYNNGSLSDRATCADCLREVLDPHNRRRGYPFTSCNACGPRYTITESLSCDRGPTTAGSLMMCAACRAEYDDPSDRRYHARFNACPVCGPQLSCSIDAIVGAVRYGAIVALKGLGGFHLLCDATDPAAVDR